jgi:hypothetical protein
MNMRIIKIGLCFSLLSLLARGEDDRPVLKEPSAKLVAVIESMAEENVAAARINVAHDVAQKRLRIFSIVPARKAGKPRERGYEVKIIYNPNLTASKGGVGSYRFQNNNQVLSFAAAQFTSGNKAFARRLVTLLAEAAPDLFWSSPTDPVITIKQILAGLEKDDETVKPFLADESQVWAETVKRYGP